MKDIDRATVNVLVKWVSECSKRFSGPNIECDELAQIVLEKILKTKAPPRKLSYSWVYAITANAKNDMLRSAYREKKVDGFKSFNRYDKARSSARGSSEDSRKYAA